VPDPIYSFRYHRLFASPGFLHAEGSGSHQCPGGLIPMRLRWFYNGNLKLASFSLQLCGGHYSGCSSSDNYDLVVGLLSHCSLRSEERRVGKDSTSMILSSSYQDITISIIT